MNDGYQYGLSRAFVRFTAGTTPSLLAHGTVWNGYDQDPVVAHTGTGTYTITYPTNNSNLAYMDRLHTAIVYLENNTFGFCSASASKNVVTINLAGVNGAANDMTGKNVMVIIL